MQIDVDLCAMISSASQCAASMLSARCSAVIWGVGGDEDAAPGRRFRRELGANDFDFGSRNRQQRVVCSAGAGAESLRF